MPWTLWAIATVDRVVVFLLVDSHLPKAGRISSPGLLKIKNTRFLSLYILTQVRRQSVRRGYVIMTRYNKL